MEPQRLRRIKELLEEIYRLIDEEPEPEPVEAPANVTPIRSDDEVELEGVIGRPELKTVKGKSRFTAGLGVQEGNVTQWHSLVAWGSTAHDASSLQRGQRVRVVGKPKETSYVDSQGVMQVKNELTALVISPVTHAELASSEATASRVRRNGTT